MFPKITNLLLILLYTGHTCGHKLAFDGMTAFAAPNHVVGQPDYQIASVDLSRGWIDLVENNKVEARVTLPIDASNVHVKYGVRLTTLEDTPSGSRCEEFVQEIIEEKDGYSPCESILKINQTLSNLQQQEDKSSSNIGKTVKYEIDDDGFVAQLQLVRTLRPPPSPGFSETTTSVPPPYNSETDSFVTGPLRLELRPLVASLNLSKTITNWDVFHNVSPADTRGHFLLIPTLSEKDSNWRGQSFTETDCHDIVLLTESIRPFGSLLIGFNSVGAGASQNHIHCHCWPSPPLPFLGQDPSITEDGEKESKSDGWNCYAVSNVTSIHDFFDLENDTVQCSYLKYPVFCVQFSASRDNLNRLAKALSVSLDAIRDAPYNIGFLNRPASEENDRNDSFVDAFLFVRSKERSDDLPTLKLGISEMMGLFHAQSDSELEALLTTELIGDDDKKVSAMVQALENVSVETEESLWIKIKEKLIQLDKIHNQ